MVDRLRGRQHIHHPHLRVNPAGQAGAEDGIRPVLLHQPHRPYSGIHLADAALPQHNIVATQATAVATERRLHLAVLDIHRDDDTYLHASALYLSAASTKATKSGCGCMAVDLYSG